MRYEKKMLILSGEGKGVVLMERSALGVKFALRTFSVPPTAGLKVGVIARSCVVIRELPSCADPSLVFYIDDSNLDLTYLHFAVFDDSLILYGAIGKRMWEANIMDLLNKADRMSAPPPLLRRPVEPAPIAPVVTTALPDPDGSGNPQLRAVYGDDLIAGDNYYTPFDISSRMKEVDGFLDTPRILDGLSPRIQSAAAKQAEYIPPGHEKTEVKQTEQIKTEVEATEVKQEEHIKAETEQVEAEQTECVPAEVEETEVKQAEYIPQEAEIEVRDENVDEIVTADMGSERQDSAPMQEAAAVAGTVETPPEGKMLPWEREAQYVKSLCDSVEIKDGPKPVPQVKAKSKVKKVRESTFFERCRADVDKLFSSASKDGELNMILPDIDWVKVPFDGHSVSVGRGGDLFLCYAVPGRYEKVSPFGNDAQWLPKHKNAPTGKGYWLIFQDLKSGGIICG